MSTADAPTNAIRRPAIPLPPTTSRTPDEPSLEATRMLEQPCRGLDFVPSLPGFRFMDVLGRGGMGVVYKALQIGLDRIVAVKLMIGDVWLDPAARVRFAIEAEAVAAVNHPNVLPVHEFGEHAGRPFLVMDYLEGGSLSGWLKLHGKFPPVEAARLIESVARGVQAAHEAGIVHRDLKPANILFKGGGIHDSEATSTTSTLHPASKFLFPVVSDFGLAKRIGSAENLTVTGVVMGTPGYMAPEQAAGGGKSVGPSADIYALGVILYQCLTGRIPHHTDDTADLIVRTLRDEPASIRQFAPGTPPDLERICLKCLAKKPADRYLTAGAFADDLVRYLNGEPVSVRPAGLPERVVKWCRRNPAKATAYSLTGIATMLVVLTILVLGLWQKAEHVAEQHLHQAEKAVNDREKAETEREKAFEAFTHQSLDLAYRDYEAGKVEAARDRLKTCPPAARDLEWKLLDRLTSRELRTYRSGTGAIHGLAFFESRRQLGVVDRAGVKLWDAEGDAPPLMVYNAAAAGVAWGKTRIAVFEDNYNVHILDAFTRQRLHVFNMGKWFRSGSFNPDGTRLLAIGGNEAALFDTTTGKRLQSFQFNDGHISTGAISPDGSFLALGGREQKDSMGGAAVGTFKIYTLAGYAWPTVVRTESDSVEALAIAPNSKRIAVGSRDGSVKQWDVHSPAVVESFRIPVGGVSAIAYSPDGLSLATGGVDDPAVRVWQAVSGREQRVFRGHAAPVMRLSFSPDGTRVASSDSAGTAKVWDLTQPPDSLLLAGMNRDPIAAAISNDGLTLFTSDGPSGVHAWNLHTGELLWSSSPAELVRFLHLSPDSKVLVIGTRLGLLLGRSAATGQSLVLSIPLTLNASPVGLTADRSQALIRTNAGEVRLLSLTQGQVKAEMPGKHAVSRSSICADGSRIAVMTEDGRLLMWNTLTQDVRPVESQGSRVASFALSPDGRRLAAALDDGRLTFWDTSTHQELLSLRPRVDKIAVLTFSPDGSKLAALGSDGAVQVLSAGK